jgi:hypothetical protein
MARVFAVMVEGLLVRVVSRYNVECEPENYHRLQNLMRARARSRYKALENCPDAGAPACRQAGRQKP